MIVGAVVGAYVPLNLYARDQDCYSRIFQASLLFVEYSQFADGNSLTAVQWALLGVNILQDGVALYSAINVCTEQLQYSRDTHWLDWYNPPADVEIVVEFGDENDNTTTLDDESIPEDASDETIAAFKNMRKINNHRIKHLKQSATSDEEEPTETEFDEFAED